MRNRLSRLLARALRRLSGDAYEDLLRGLIADQGPERFSDLIPPPPNPIAEPFAFPPGHFYSPYPDLAAVQSRWSDIFGGSVEGALGLDDSASEQLALAALIEPLIRDFPYALSPEGDCVVGNHGRRPLRYECSARNTTFHLDAVILQAMLRHFRPKRVIEVGSGYSSAIMLDVREREGWHDQSLTFIEPYAQAYFYPLLRSGDSESTRILEQPLWDVDLALFEELGPSDLLFIDSSHVAKIGSDVYHYLFEILPRLKPGVLVHIHDISANYEIPPSWFENGWYWNEGAFLRAFLMYNQEFEVVFHAHRLCEHHPGAPGVAALLEKCETTFVRPEWQWANSFYMRRRDAPVRR